jgi:hypothetical protein
VNVLGPDLLFDPQDNPNAPALKFFDVARDGVQFAPANYSSATSDTSLVLAPGGRLDVFVQAPSTPGTYLLKRRIHPRPLARSFRGLRAGRNAGAGITGATNTSAPLDTALLIVKVQSPAAGAQPARPRQTPQARPQVRKDPQPQQHHH